MTGVTLLQILVVLAVIAAVAAVAAGYVRGGMAEPTSSVPLFELPQGRPLSAADVADVRFSLAARGYRMSHVDDVLTRLAAELADRDAELARLRADDDAVPVGDPAAPQLVEAAQPMQPAQPVPPPEPGTGASPAGSGGWAQPSAQRDV